MKHHDALGLSLTGASAAAATLFDRTLRSLQTYTGDPVASLSEALEDSPGFLLGHVTLAWLCLTGTDRDSLLAAQEALAKAEPLAASGDERERGHLRAAKQWADGRWADAARSLEDLAIAEPRDLLALQLGHLLDFFRGDARMLRDRIARALPAWSAAMPGYATLLGMHAFGLEENGQYAEAEATGRRAVALDRRDTWSWHAVGHVLEMQDRIDDGIDWWCSDGPAWAEDSFFSVHNWWHLALLHLERGEIGRVFALFDGPIFGDGKTVVLDLIDASALLWRLQLRGIDVGDRWARVADAWAPRAADGWYAFNDVHAGLAFAAAGQGDRLQAVHAAMARAVAEGGDNAAFTADVGAPLLASLLALHDGEHARAVRGLRQVRPIAHRFGGSHAQRDLIDLSLLEAAIRSGDHALAAALAAERAARQPTRGSTARLLSRALAGPASRAAA